MMGDLIAVIDAGTTSTRTMVFAADGALVKQASRPITQCYPRDGWVEHDAGEIWRESLAALREAVSAAGGVGRIAALGITNQRETVVAWDRRTGEPLARAIVWQDRRTSDVCARLRAAGHEAAVQARTGLLLDPYFSATKMRWLIENEPAVADAAGGGRLALGTVESWLVWCLTGGLFITDATNASRTSLLPLAEAGWDAGLADLFGVPLGTLAEVVDCAGHFGLTRAEWLGGAVPVSGLAGDQQAATIGQGCTAPGTVKATYGTGAFVLASTGEALPHSRNQLLGTALTQVAGRRTYALEGSVFVAGSLVQWLRDALGIIASATETAELAASVPDTAGVVMVPALSGLGAPHWRPDARGSITGLSFAATRAHIVRAALEAMAHQTHDLAEAFAADGAPWRRLRIDGGMSANDWMARDIAGLLAVPVARPDCVESTALGAAMLAGVGCGLFAGLDQAAAMMGGPALTFAPDMDAQTRATRLARWRAAIDAVLISR